MVTTKVIGRSVQRLIVENESNLVAGYNFQTNNDQTDVSSAGNNATTTSTMLNITKLGRALNFDGVKSQMDCGNSSSLKFNGSDIVFTYSMWIKPKKLEATTKALFHSNNSIQFLLIPNKKTYVYCWGSLVNSELYGTTELLENTWYHVGFTIDSDRVGKLYLNGVVEDSKDMTGSIDAPTSNFFIGQRGYNLDQSFDGEIIVPKIYKNEAKSDDWFAKEYAKNEVIYFKTDFGANANNTAQTDMIENTLLRAISGSFKVINDTYNNENIKAIECVSSGSFELPIFYGGTIWEMFYNSGSGYIKTDGSGIVSGKTFDMTTGDKIILGNITGNYSIFKR